MKTFTLALLPLTLWLGASLAQAATPEKPLTPAQCKAALKAKVKLNSDSLETLKCLPGVVESIAKDIILNRTFSSQRDFEIKIEGRGAKLWKGFSQFVSLELLKKP